MTSLSLESAERILDKLYSESYPQAKWPTRCWWAHEIDIIKRDEIINKCFKNDWIFTFSRGERYEALAYILLNSPAIR